MDRHAPLMLALVSALTCTTLWRAQFYAYWAYWNENAPVFPDVAANNHDVATAARDDPPVPNPVGPAPDPPPARKVNLHAIIREAAHLYGLDTDLLHAIIVVESGYNPRAVSPKGAIGLMQLMPQTARQYGVADPYDPFQNVRGGAQHLRHLLRRFDDDLELSVAAYNAGEWAIIARDGNIPPYPETQQYVLKVIEHYERLRAQGIAASLARSSPGAMRGDR